MSPSKAGIYFASNVAQAGLQFVLVPLLMRSMGPAEYGRWGLFEPILAASALVALGGANWGILKLVNQDGLRSVDALKALVQKGWLVPLTVFLSIGVGAWSLGQAMDVAFAMALAVCAEACLSLILAAARAENFASVYALGIIIKFSGLTALAMAAAETSWPDISSASSLIIWWAAAAGVAASIACLFLLRQSSKQGLREIAVPLSLAAKSSLKYGGPLLGSSILSIALNNTDRFVLQHFISPEQLGAYVVATKIAGAMNFILVPVSLWWPTARFIHFKDNDGGQRFFSLSAEAMALGYGTTSAALWTCSENFISWFTPQVTVSSFIMFSLCMAQLFRGLEPPLNVGLLKEGYTHLSIFAVGMTATIQLVLCLLVAPIGGGEAVAGATMLGCGIGTALIHTMSQRIHRINIAYLHLISYMTIPWILAFAFKMFDLYWIISFVGVLIGAVLLAGRNWLLKIGSPK